MTSPSTACLDDQDVAEILEGDAAPEILAAAEDHAAACESCRRVLAAAAKVRAGEARAHAADPTEPRFEEATADGAHADVPFPEHLGDAIGRYRIEEVVGRGGMGVVYAAKDDTLQRTVALKLLNRSVIREDSRSRLLREARAMASVDHPNVLSVHDVGLHDGLVYIVMDLVDGGDLRQWLRERVHPWRDIVATFIAAGRGLAAIHEVGLVHRDFKPANVLVGRGGRVQITDFGLVGGAGSSEPRPDSSTLRGILGDDRTETGLVLGTPRYMSPEQIRGDAVDAFSDQFSFCVALWESVTGHHPFGGGATVDRIAQMKHGPLADARGPSELLSVLRRGLAPTPADRFASMDPLLEALARAAERRHRRRRVTVASVLLVGAVGLGVELGGSGHSDPCPDTASDDFVRIWDEPTRKALRAASEGDAQWSRFAELVDDYTTRWSEERRDACVDTRVRGEVSEEMLDRRMACLHRARTGLAATTEVMMSSKDETRPDLVELALRLPDPQRCSDLGALATMAPRPSDPELVAAIDGLDAENITAATLAFAGRADEAEQRVDAALPKAREIGWAPLTAALLDRRALLTAREDPAAAVPTWREAYVLAVPAGHLTAFEVGLDGARLLADADRLEEAEFILEIAAGLADELGGEPRPGELASLRALHARLRGDFVAAVRHTRDEVDRRTTTGDRPGQARALSNLTGLLAASGRTEEALEIGARALRVSSDAYGTTHPQTTSALHNLAYIQFVLGRYAESRAMAEDCLARLASLDVPRQRARTLGLLADLAQAEGDYDGALGFLRDALELATTSRAPFGQVGYVRSKIGEVLLDAGRNEDAITELELATKGLRDEGLEAVTLADSYAKLSAAYDAIGNDGAQIEAAERAYEIGRDLPDHHGTLAMQAYAAALAEKGRRSEALGILDRTVSLVAPLEEASPRFQADILLDRAGLRAREGQLASAREDVERARSLLDAAGDRDNEQWTRAEAWLRDHPSN